MLDVGICGKPNSGKSTFFSAATMIDVAIANYPFTTIKANRGVAYVRAKCPCKELGKPCNPRNSKCIDGVRLVPTTIIDVAGLVPGAHEGRGLGNKFLDDLRNASAIIQVVDASGRTDLEGNPAEAADPLQEVSMLEEEVAQWMCGIIMKGIGLRKTCNAEGVATHMSGLGITRVHVLEVCDELGLAHAAISFESEVGVLAFARALRGVSKPIMIAANKMDLKGAEANFERLVENYGEGRVVPCYADGELALRKAERAGIVKYVPGAQEFEIVGGDARQREALGRIGQIMKAAGGTGIQEALDKVVFGVLGMLVVYPVEDATRMSDHAGNVLPDALLLKKGSTALDLAAAIHTELAEKFICAVDVRKGMKVGKEYVLRDGDVLRVVVNR